MDLSEFQAGSECARAQSRAAALFDLYNRETPRPQVGENPNRYRRRLLETAAALLPATSPWRGVPISNQPDSALDSVEAALLDDQVADFRAPRGPLRQVEGRDEAGRTVRRFFGDPEHTWARFKGVRRVVTAWTTAGRGSDSPSGRARAAARAAALYAAGL
jgi:hypothetical protein